MSPERLASFNRAWGDSDLNALMDLVSEDCVYAASVGPEPGTTYVGRDEVRRGFTELLAYEEDCEEGRGGPIYIHGNRGFCEWSYRLPQADGSRVEVRGCDFFEFEGNRIRRKDAFIKSLPMKKV